MKIDQTLVLNKENLKSSVFDAVALVFIFFVPAISHLFSFPVYFLEPMRIMLIIAIVHTSRRNSYIIAATLPLFSFLISAHPHFIKMMLITVELLLNVWLFFILMKKLKNSFISMMSAIILSKLFYYGIKFALISIVLLDGKLVSTPIYFQCITTLVFSLYIMMVFWIRTSKN